MHFNKLKTNPKYLNHHVIRRCNDLLETLLLFEEDMYHQRKYCGMRQAVAKHDGVNRQRTQTEIPKKDVEVHKSQYYWMLLNNPIRSLTMMMISSVLHPPKNRSWPVHTHNTAICCNHMVTLHALFLSDLSAQNKSIEDYLHQIQQGIESVQEPEVLKQVLSLVTQATSALKSAGNPDNIHPFTVKERFAPAQKNECNIRKPVAVQLLVHIVKRCPAPYGDSTWARSY